MPAALGSHERFWTSVRRSWSDNASPSRVTLAEWQSLIQPALEQQRDLTAATLRDLGRFASSWTSVDGDAKAAASAWIRTEAPKYQPSTPAGGTIQLPAKRGHSAQLDPKVGFVGTDGRPPADLKALIDLLWHAGEWLQASFGSTAGLYDKLDSAGKQAVLGQLERATSGSLSVLNSQQQDQLLGAAAALTAELIKACDVGSRLPGVAQSEAAVRDAAFAALERLLGDRQLSVLIRRQLTSYLVDAPAFTGKTTAAQRARLGALHKALTPERPLDYARWDREGRSRIVVDHASGTGEGFLYGFAKALEGKGLGDARGMFDSAGLKFKLAKGSDLYNGPLTYELLVPKGHALNAWGRDMTVEVRLREFRSDMYKAIGDASVDIVSYGGHSNFGGNTLTSLSSAPQQVGEKVMLRDLCAAADTRNAEAKKLPEASANSVHSVSSTYFRTQNDPRYGKYAHESEGYEMMMHVLRGILGKKSWSQIGPRLPNWWGHDTDNNWSWPGDPRGNSYVDYDGDGIPNVFDLMPSYNTVKVAESTAREFRLELPAQPWAQIDGERAFQALQFTNTATNYNPHLQPANAGRKLTAHPQGIFFDGAGTQELARFTAARDGSIFVQLSTRLAAMTMESMRAVLYFEAVRYFGKQDKSLFADQAEMNAMGLLFAMASIEYDQSSRDRAVFDGLKQIYNLPSSVDFNDVHRILGECDSKRHNYTGDAQGMAALVAKYKRELGASGAGQPTLPSGVA